MVRPYLARVGRFLHRDERRADSHYSVERVSGSLPAAWRRQQGHLDFVRWAGKPDDAAAFGAQPIPFSRGAGDLPSRIADDLFWLGRYVERAEAQVRLARAAYRRIIEENGFEEIRAAEILARIPSALPSVQDDTSAEEFVNYVSETRKAEESPRTVIQIQSLARVLRDTASGGLLAKLAGVLPRHLATRADPVEPRVSGLSFCKTWSRRSRRLAGLTADSMMHSQSWRFLDMGRRIERAIFIAQLLSDTLVNPGNDPALLEAILEITESSFPYRRKYLTRFENARRREIFCSPKRAIRVRWPSNWRRLPSTWRAAARPRHSRRRSRPATALGLRTSIQTANLADCAGAARPAARRPRGVLVRSSRPDRANLRCHRAFIFLSRHGIACARARLQEEFLRYRVTHSTQIQLRAAVSLSHNIVRMRPRNHDLQSCLRHRLTIVPPAATQQRTTATISEITATTSACRNRIASWPLPLGVKWRSRPPRPTFPMVRPGSKSAKLLLHDSDPETCPPANSASIRLTCRGRSSWRAYAHALLREGRPFLQCVLDLTKRIHREFEFLPGSTRIGTPVLEVLTQPARRLPGLCSSANRLLAFAGIGCALRQRLSGHHSASGPAAFGGRGCLACLGRRFCAGSTGWIDFDPTNGLMPSDWHITVAWGARLQRRRTDSRDPGRRPAPAPAGFGRCVAGRDANLMARFPSACWTLRNYRLLYRVICPVKGSAPIVPRNSSRYAGELTLASCSRAWRTRSCTSKPTVAGTIVILEF